MSRLVFDPIIPFALWLPLALAAASVLVAYYFSSRSRIGGKRRGIVLSLMALSIVLPLAILLNPTWVEPLPPPAGKPRLTILVDESASMATTDSPGGKSRYADAVRIADQMVAQLKNQFDVRIRSFAENGSWTDSAKLVASKPDGASTDLAAAIEQSLDEQPQGQFMLLLSDGIHNAGGGAMRVRRSVEKARAMAAPIYTRTSGGKTTAKDVEVSLNLPQEMAFVGQSVPIRVSVRQRGSVTDLARISVALDDKILESQDVALRPDATSEATFQVGQSANGLYRFEFRVDQHANEVTAVNNVATLLLRVVDEPVRVLLLEGKPYWDTKFLVRTLAGDQSIELTSIVCMTPGRFLQRDISRPQTQLGESTALPTTTPATVTNPQSANDGNELVLRKEAWKVLADARKLLSDPAILSSYQIIVLGRDAEIYLNDQVLAQWKKWLTNGNGSLVCFRGAPSSQVSQRLGELMPVRWSPRRESRFRVRLTESGQSLHWLPNAGGDEDVLANLPSLASVTQPERPKPLAVVLATAVGEAEQHEPVISYQPIGNGRVVIVEGTGMWRWAFLPPEHQDHDATYGLLWRSLVRWLVANAGLLPSQQLAMRSDKVIFATGETASATLLMREAGEPPQIELTGGKLDQPQRFTPVSTGTSAGQFRVVFGRLAEGRYRAKVVGAEDRDSASIAPFDVRGSLEERLDIAARPDLMALIAQQSGGAVLKADDASELSQKFTEHLSASLPQRTVRVMAWDRWWVLSVVLAQWAMAWGLRRATGLV
jgi:hypothetical protein